MRVQCLCEDTISGAVDKLLAQLSGWQLYCGEAQHHPGACEHFLQVRSTLAFDRARVAGVRGLNRARRSLAQRWGVVCSHGGFRRSPG
jgi:hypothetical protein